MGRRSYNSEVIRLKGELSAIRPLLVTADSYLSLLAYRNRNSIIWGSVSAPEFYEMEAIVTKLRKAADQIPDDAKNARTEEIAKAIEENNEPIPKKEGG